VQETQRDGRDIIDCFLEAGFVGFRRLIEAGNLAHKLQRCGLNFLFGNRRIEIEKRLDVSAHIDGLDAKSDWAALAADAENSTLTLLFPPQGAAKKVVLRPIRPKNRNFSAQLVIFRILCTRLRPAFCLA
jgi:hypothetical protein